MFAFELSSQDAWVWILSLSVILVVLVGKWHSPWDSIADAISLVLNAYLNWRYPIYAADGSGHPIPTCPYRWPNGQGDVAKFLDGTEKSEEWRKRYGGVYRIWSGMHPEIVLSDPEDIRIVFKDSNNHAKATDNNSGYLMHHLLGQCVGLINHGPWKSVRSVTELPFVASTSRSYIQLITTRTQEYFEALLAQADGNLARGLIDPVQDLKLLPFRIVTDIIYGRLDEAARQELEELIPLREGLWRQMIAGGITRFWCARYLPFKVNAQLRQWKTRWGRFNDARAAEGATLKKVKDSSDAIAPITLMYDSVRQGTLTREQLLQTIDEMLFANLDVTMGGVSWNLVFLASSPAVQAQLRTEVAAHRQASLELSNEAADPFAKFLQSSSSLLNACILESARLRPLAAFSVPQSAPSARTVGGAGGPGMGFVVPKGVSFIIDTHALNIYHPFWGTSREESVNFRPGRHMELRSTDMRYQYWRFGFGPRQCMGKYVADLIMRVLLVHLVEEYQLALLPEDVGADWGRDGASWIVHPKITLQCKRRDMNQ